MFWNFRPAAASASAAAHSQRQPLKQDSQQVERRRASLQKLDISSSFRLEVSTEKHRNRNFDPNWKIPRVVSTTTTVNCHNYNFANNFSQKWDAMAYSHLLRSVTPDSGGQEIKFFDIAKLGDEFQKLPFSIRILLESAVRNCDNFQVSFKLFLNWKIIWKSGIFVCFENVLFWKVACFKKWMLR